MTLVIILFNVFTPQGLIISKKIASQGEAETGAKNSGKKRRQREKRKEKKEERKRRREEGGREGGIGYRHNAREWRPRLYR